MLLYMTVGSITVVKCSPLVRGVAGSNIQTRSNKFFWLSQNWHWDWNYRPFLDIIVRLSPLILNHIRLQIPRLKKIRHLKVNYDISPPNPFHVFQNLITFLSLSMVCYQAQLRDKIPLIQLQTCIIRVVVWTDCSPVTR